MQAVAASMYPRHELRFTELFNEGHGYTFPCDVHGSVDIDRLPERARANYLFARGAIGWQFHVPVTCRVVQEDCDQPTRAA